jgi:hypothetical protein
MSNDKVETTDVTAMLDRQVIERNKNGMQAPGPTPPGRPWTADFLLPSISFHRSKPA